MKTFLLCVLAGLLTLVPTSSNAQARGRQGAGQAMARRGHHVQHRRGTLTGSTTKSLARKKTGFTRTTRKATGKKGQLRRKHKHLNKRGHKHKKDKWHRKRKHKSSDGGDNGGDGGDDADSDESGGSAGDTGDDEEADSGSADEGGGTQVADNSDTEEEAAAPATLLVTLPTGARLFIDGSPTTSTGPRRVFSTPALAPGQAFHYTLRAELVREGRPVRVEKRVEVRAGEETEVSLMPPTPHSRRPQAASDEDEEGDDGGE